MKRKTILWLEDFANDHAPVMDIFSEAPPDRSLQIKAIFPEYLVEHVQVLEDPTQLAEQMSLHGSDYELILLDVNFEDGLSQDPDKQDAFLSELRQAQIEIDSLNTETIKKLGYHMFNYLNSRWNVPVSRMAIFSAYSYADEASGLFDRTILGSRRPNRFDKSEPEKLRNYLNTFFSPDAVTSKAAILQAKNLFYYWNQKEISDDSILLSSHAGNRHLEKSEISKRIAYVLDTVNTCGQEAFGPILHALAYPFEAQLKQDAPYWNKTMFESLKLLRNMLSHRKKTSYNLSPAEFLILTFMGLRAIYESTTSPEPLLQEEQWLIDRLRETIQTAGVVAQLDQQQRKVRCEEVMLKWYFSMVHMSGFMGEGYTMLCSQKARSIYELSDIVHLMCMKALGAHIKVNPRINSEMPCGPHSGFFTTSSPTIMCFMNSRFTKERYAVPAAAYQIAEQFVLSCITNQSRLESSLIVI